MPSLKLMPYDPLPVLSGLMETTSYAGSFAFVFPVCVADALWGALACANNAGDAGMVMMMATASVPRTPIALQRVPDALWT